jgi:hypothetical protein
MFGVCEFEQFDRRAILDDERDADTVGWAVRRNQDFAAGKLGGEVGGRWESTSGQAGNQVIFRSGKVTVTEAFQRFSDLDCFIGEGKVFLYKAGSFMPFNEPMEINTDGTLETELGAIKKMATEEVSRRGHSASISILAAKL